MAGIDKTYIKSYKELKDFINWAEKIIYTCPNGIIFKPKDYIYSSCLDKSEEEIQEILKHHPEIPIMNTPQDLDYFLIKDCPLDFIQERMKEVYGEEYIESILNGDSEFDKFVYPETGNKIKIIETPKTKKAISWFNCQGKKKGYYSIFVENSYCFYNEDLDKWMMFDELGSSMCSMGTIQTKSRSLKSLIRRIKKWNLPKGSIIQFYGNGNQSESFGKLLIL